MSKHSLTIRLVVNGLPCWHRVDVSPTKLPLLRRLQTGETINVATLGRILASGWGEPPCTIRIDYSAITA